MSLTINFGGEQAIDIPGARVLGIPSGQATFGVKRCELRFTLMRCQLPLDKVTLIAPLKRSVAVETQRERATETQVGATLGGTVGEKPSGTGSGTLGFKQGDKTVEKVTTERWQIHYIGSEEAPMWVFEVKNCDTILRGALTREQLGTVLLDSGVQQREMSLQSEVQPGAIPSLPLAQKTPSALKAIVTVRAEDVRLTWGKLGWTPNITRNRLALIERAIALKHIGPQLNNSTLSTTGWQYGGH
jgi:hypothetical protein